MTQAGREERQPGPSPLPDGALWPRRWSRTGEARRALAAQDRLIAAYTCGDITRTVRVANTTPSRADILDLRRRHYQRKLAELGVPVWDEHDETAVQLLCTEGSHGDVQEPVGVLRVTLNRGGQGDLYEDFAQLDEVLDDTDEMLVFARELVVPRRRGSGVATVLAHAACLYGKTQSTARRVMFTSISQPGRPSAPFGATPVSAPLALGPAATPVVLFSAELDTLTDGTNCRLRRTGWSVSPRLDLAAPEQPPLRLPLAAGGPAEPPARYRRLRSERPVCRVRMPTGDLAWLVTRYEDARFVLADRRFSKAALLEPGAPRIRPGTLPPGLLFTTDPPEHTDLRARARMVLSRAHVAAAREVFAEFADELLVGLATAQEADLVEDFAAPLAMRVMSHLLGVHEADRERAAHWARTVLTTGGAGHDEVEQAQCELMAYCSALATARRVDQAGDPVSALIDADAGGGDDIDIIADTGTDGAGPLIATLLVTGYETMVAAVSNAVLILLVSGGGLPAPWPEDSRQLVEELLRLSTFGDALRSRRTTADVRLGDVTVPAGDVVLVSLASANRDEAVFTEPDRLRPGPEGPGHIAFGHGPHRCPGAGLARTELDVALDRLANRFPGMRLAVAPEEIVLRSGSAESPPEALPVRLGPLTP